MAAHKANIKKWGELRDALSAWHAKRVEKATEQLREDAKELLNNIKTELKNVKKSSTSSAIDAATNVSAVAKAAKLAPKGSESKDVHKDKISKDPISGLDLYVNSIIIDEEGSGTDVVQVVKIDKPHKIDETTGMEVAKIAKAIEFGTTKSAPRSAWRRSLMKLRLTGVYKEQR